MARTVKEPAKGAAGFRATGSAKTDGIVLATCLGATYEEVAWAFGMDPSHVRTALCPSHEDALPRAVVDGLAEVWDVVWAGAAPALADVIAKADARDGADALVLGSDSLFDMLVEGGLEVLGPRLAPVVSAGAASAANALACALGANVVAHRDRYARGQSLHGAIGCLFSAGLDPEDSAVNGATFGMFDDEGRRARMRGLLEPLDDCGWDDWCCPTGERSEVAMECAQALVRALMNDAALEAEIVRAGSMAEGPDGGPCPVAECPAPETAPTVEAWEERSCRASLRNTMACAVAALDGTPVASGRAA